MSLVADLALGGMTLVAGLVGLAYARDGVRSVAATARVLTGPEAVPDGDGATFLTLSLADAPDVGPVAIGQVHDTFGYWLVRYWASGGTSYGIVGGLLMRAVFDPDDYRVDDARRRGSAVDPETVRARVGGRLRDVTFAGDAYPCQRLEADGATVPFLVGVGASVAFGVGLVSSTVPVMLRLYPRFGWGVLAVVGLTVAGVVAGKRYHDTAAVGRWDAVTGLDDDAVPDALAAAGDTGDPRRTAMADLAAVSPGETLRVVGTVESTARGLRVVDGVVSTRGRGFLAVAVTLGAARSFAVAAVALAVAGALLVALEPSLLGWVRGVV